MVLVGIRNWDVFPTTGMTPPETSGDVFYVLVSARVLVR